jgi:hypothetical protein
MTKKEFDSRMKKIQKINEQIEFKNKLRAEKNKFRRFKISKMNTSNKVLIASILAIVLFTIACLYIQYKTEVEVSGTLITLWYSFWTVEIVALTGIKITKVIKDYDSLSEPFNSFDNE